MKNVLITGGSRGIGKACVEYFAEHGWRVFFTYHKNDDLAYKTAKENDAIKIKCDVSKKDDLELISAQIDKFGESFDCIVNNAGISEQILFTQIDEQKWDRMFDVNIKGMYLTTHRFIPAMISRHSGSIVNISSVWGIEGGSCEVHYAASKAAVIGFTKALASEMGPSGIRVNCVAPGVIDTDMNAHLSDEDMDVLKNETPLMQIGTAAQVAKAVYFLADTDSFITGEVIKVSGGF